jgi:ABC-type multidrug transport system permease subunit
MRLKQIGGWIIGTGMLFGAIAVRVAQPNTWLAKFWPLLMFGFLLVGATIGIAGFVSAAIDKHRSRKSE